MVNNDVLGGAFPIPVPSVAHRSVTGALVTGQSLVSHQSTVRLPTIGAGKHRTPEPILRGIDIWEAPSYISAIYFLLLPVHCSIYFCYIFFSLISDFIRLMMSFVRLAMKRVLYYIYRLRKKKQNFPQTAEQPPGVQESRLSRAPSLSAVAQAWIHIGIKLKIFSHFLYIWKKIQPSCWKDALFKGLPDGCKASHRQTTSFTRLCHESSKIFTFIPMCNFSLLALGNPACHVRYLSLSLSLSLSRL